MKLASTAFSTESRHLLEVIDCLQEGIILLNQHGEIAWANDSALRLHDTNRLSSLSPMVAHYWHHLAPASGSQEPANNKGRALSPLLVKSCLPGGLAPTDSARPLQIRHLLLNNDSGQVEGIALIIRNHLQQDEITRPPETTPSLSWCDDKTAAQDPSLASSFATLFHHAPLAMLVSDAEGNVLDVNPAFIATTGYTYALLRQGSRTLAPLLCEPQRYEEAVAALSKGADAHHVELLLCTYSGQVLDCVVSVIALPIGKQACLLTLIQDGTERKCNEADLKEAIQAALHDATWFSEAVMEKLAQLRQPTTMSIDSAELADLTPREREILGLMCQDMTDQEIAFNLNVSPHTVRNHVASLYSKLAVHRRSAAIIWARQRGITC